MIIRSNKCRQCGITIPEMRPDLDIEQDGFVITAIAGICKKGHLQPMEFADNDD